MKGKPKAETLLKLVLPPDVNLDKYVDLNVQLTMHRLRAPKNCAKAAKERHALLSQIWTAQRCTKTLMAANVPNLIQYFCSRLVAPVSKKGKLVCTCNQALPHDNHWRHCNDVVTKVQNHKDVDFAVKPCLATLHHLQTNDFRPFHNVLQRDQRQLALTDGVQQNEKSSQLQSLNFKLKVIKQTITKLTLSKNRGAPHSENANSRRTQ